MSEENGWNRLINAHEPDGLELPFDIHMVKSEVAQELTPALVAQISSAMSLKRIADALEKAVGNMDKYRGVKLF